VARKRDVVDVDSLASVIGTAALEAVRERDATGYDVGSAVVTALELAGWRIVREHPRLPPEARACPAGPPP
jgi:hypothetical protein